MPSKTIGSAKERSTLAFKSYRWEAPFDNSEGHLNFAFTTKVGHSPNP
jgi:hypothetical protein